MWPNFKYVRPGKIKDVLNSLKQPGARVHGGGTDLLGCLRDGVFGAEKLVSLQGLEDLRGIRETSDGGLRIGALTTIAELATSDKVREKYPVLAQAASEVASPQLRNQGTIGGNLCQKPRCWYYRGEFHCLRKGGRTCFAIGGENQFHCIFGGENCYIVHPSDPAPALAALEAEVEAEGPGGRRRIPVDRFHVPPSRDYTRETVLEEAEIITAVVTPPPKPGLRSAYRKVRTRRSWDFSLAGTALALTFDGGKVTGGRVFFSGVAPTPWRSKEVEDEIAGRRIDDAAAAAAGRAAVSGASPMEKNGYKAALLSGVVREELMKLAAA